tara:strand:+ start:466 stop:1026 length:561 start_codon:yes stop_codon:yes gene_type:complete
MFLICGLGNPGKKYINTRHNIGFRSIDKLIDHFNFNIIKEDKVKKLYSGIIGNYKVFILKPLTFMNLSGKAVLETINFYKINKDNVFVIHDDLDLKLTKTKIKKGGGSGGHNGLLSIDDNIGNDYNRIRIGIDHPGQKDLVSDYVLSNFSMEEKIIVDKKLEKLKDNIHTLFSNVPLFLTKINEEN